MNAKELSELSTLEIFAKFAPKCVVCVEPIAEHSEEQYNLGGQPAHEDCYYDVAGKIIEQHPIYNPSHLMSITGKGKQYTCKDQ